MKEIFRIFLGYLLLFSFHFPGSALGAGIPSSWQRKIQQGNMIFSPTEPAGYPDLLPTIGNGYVGGFVMDQSIYIAGIYNGILLDKVLDSCHRARIPSTNVATFSCLSCPSTSQPNAVGFALDIEEGVYLRRFDFLNSDGHAIEVEQAFYAHRFLKNLWISTISINNTSPSAQAQIKLNYVQPSPTTDVDFTTVSSTPAFIVLVRNPSNLRVRKREGGGERDFFNSN